MATQITIREVPISFPQLFERRVPPGVLNATPKFSAEFLVPIDHPQVGEIKQICFNEAAATFGADKAPHMATPLKTADEVNAERRRKGKDARPEVTGRYRISASNANAVLIADESGQGHLNTASDMEEKTWLEHMKSRIGAGVIVNALVEIYGFPQKQNPGVFCSLKGVQFVRDSGPGVMDLGGDRPAPTNAFAPVAGAAPSNPASAPWQSRGEPVVETNTDDLI
jgi:hypothetical protein